MANLSNINNKFLVTTTGEVLIGQTANNGNRLQITGADGVGYIYLKTDVATTGGRIGFNSDHLRIFNQQATGDLSFGTAGTEKMRIDSYGDVLMGAQTNILAPPNGILKIKTSGTTANTCYPLVYIGGSTHLASRQYGIGFDPEGYQNRMKLFFGVDGMGLGYSLGDFVWNINQVANSNVVTPADERMRLTKDGNLGIGMTSPTASLGIRANFGANGSYTTSGWSRYLVLDAASSGGGGIIWTKQSSTYNRGIMVNQGGFFVGRSTANDASAAWLTDLSIDAAGVSTFEKAVNIAGTLTLDQGSLLNGIINTPASLRINIDSNNSNVGEVFIVGHNQTNIDNNNVLFKVEENGNATFKNNISVTDGTLTLNKSDGSLVKFVYNGTTRGYIGSSRQLFIGGLEADMGYLATGDSVFGAGGAERMRITSAGLLFVGDTTTNYGYASHHIALPSSQGYALIVRNSDTSTTNNSAVQLNLATTGTNGYFTICRQGDPNTGTNKLFILATGNVQNVNNSYGAISDKRKKENIVDATPKLDDLMKVKIRNFNLKGEETKQIGVVAQELEEVFPGMIEESKDPDSDDETLYKSVKYSVFVPMLIKAIQELKAEIEILKKK